MNSSNLNCESVKSLDDNMDSLFGNVASRLVLAPRIGIAGFQELSLLDYPGKLSCIIFMLGCNFRCPFCHNSPLACKTEKDVMTLDELAAFLDSRKGLLEGVVISGGEPTLNPYLIPLLHYIHDKGYSIKLDTNGYKPEIISRVIASGCVDYIAMDIKGSARIYPTITGTLYLNMNALEISIAQIMQSGIDYEFRTTFIDQFHTEEDVKEMASMIEGAKAFYLQSFQDRDTVPMHNLSAPSIETLQKYKKIFEAHKIQKVEIRGREDT